MPNNTLLTEHQEGRDTSKPFTQKSVGKTKVERCPNLSAAVPKHRARKAHEGLEPREPWIPEPRPCTTTPERRPRSRAGVWMRKTSWQVLGTHPNIRNPLLSLSQAIGLQRHAERKISLLCFIFGFCQIKRILETGRAIMLKC